VSIRTSDITVGTAASHPAGSVVFRYNANHAANQAAEVGIRVGDESLIFALTPWFGGHRKPGSIINDLQTKALFGIGPESSYRVELRHDLTKLTIGSPPHNEQGELSLGTAGIHIHSGFGEVYDYKNITIDTKNWSIVDVPSTQYPTSWFDSGKIYLIDTHNNEVSAIYAWAANP
jgi:hypothetical protein